MIKEMYQRSITSAVCWLAILLTMYLNNRVFCQGTIGLIVAPRKFDVLKTNNCPRAKLRGQIWWFSGTSDFQGATIRPIVPRQTLYCIYCSSLNFLPRASSKIIANYFQPSSRTKCNIKKKTVKNSVRRQLADLSRKINTEISPVVLFSCTGSQEPIQKTQQCSTAKQRFIKKGVQWLFPLCTGTPGHNQPGVYKSKDKE